jgi:hypothetical protein
MSKVVISNLDQNDGIATLNMDTQFKVTGGLMALPGECSIGTLGGAAFGGALGGALGGAALGGLPGAVAGGVFGGAIGGAGAAVGCAIAIRMLY